jgi:hypothetical protein
MAFPREPSGAPTEARHSAEWYADAPGVVRLRAGDQLFIRCHGGPCISRLETFPPRLEIHESGGVYVLVDDGPITAWAYEFVGTFER